MKNRSSTLVRINSVIVTRIAFALDEQQNFVRVRLADHPLDLPEDLNKEFDHLHKKQQQIDYVILNSLSLFEKARPFIEHHRQYALHLDRDEAGQNCRAYAMALSRRYVDASWAYTAFKDYNEWWIKAWPPRENFRLLPDYLKHTRRG